MQVKTPITWKTCYIFPKPVSRSIYVLSLKKQYFQTKEPPHQCIFTFYNLFRISKWMERHARLVTAQGGAAQPHFWIPKSERKIHGNNKWRQLPCDQSKSWKFSRQTNVYRLLSRRGSPALTTDEDIFPARPNVVKTRHGNVFCALKRETLVAENSWVYFNCCNKHSTFAKEFNFLSQKLKATGVYFCSL